MIKKNIYILLLLISAFSYSQESRKFLYAKIIDKVGSIADVHIINLNTKLGTFTNIDGEFRILAKPNDSIQISSIGYKTSRIKVIKEHFGIKENIFQITKTAIDLDEVKVKKHNLSGILEADSKLIKSEKEINAKTLNLPFAGSRKLTKAERELHAAMTSYSGIPLDPLLNWISGRLKKLKRNKAIEDEQNRVNFLKLNYTIFIIHELKIKEDDLYRFIHFAEADKDFLSLINSGPISISQYLNRKSIEFKEINPNSY